MELRRRGKLIKKKTIVWLRCRRQSKNRGAFHALRAPPLNLIFRFQRVESLRTRVARKIQAWIAGTRSRFLLSSPIDAFSYLRVYHFSEGLSRGRSLVLTVLNYDRTRAVTIACSLEKIACEDRASACEGCGNSLINCSCCCSHQESNV